MQVDPVLLKAKSILIISLERLTCLVALAIVIPGKWIECSQLHPPSAELFRSIQYKATYVSTHLEGHTDSDSMWTSLPLLPPAPGLCFLLETCQPNLADLFLRRRTQCDGTGPCPASTPYSGDSKWVTQPSVPRFPHFIKVGTLGF